ncbi:MAG: hypothetical protein DMG40_16440 [Acidobacteria bacterium]|nr:MAG: hypothetical protein DMG40_16440 [Acidobacteriota bacterium]
MKRLAILSRVVCVALPVLALCASLIGQKPARGKIYILLWFDTEDYILPESDDAAKRLATFLTEQGIQATFKVVGEKARTLERRHRTDVIEALQKHAIGYHANTHSQHPTPAEYESLLDWEAGAAEFTRRERPGYDDVKRIFQQKPCCYGQPGSSWAPQAFPSLASWGVGLYLDEAEHVGLNGQPFYYGGLLNIFNTKEGPQLRPNDEWTNMEESKTKFRQFYEQMTSNDGGLISLYFHPCEFIHSQFWDMNFARGRNPPREQWRTYPLRPADSRERAFRYFEQLIRYMKSFPQVRFITGPQAIRLYADGAREHRFSASELLEIARQVQPEVNFQVRAAYTLSPAEVMTLLAEWNAAKLGPEASAALPFTVYGPSLPWPRPTESVQVPWPQFDRSLQDLNSFIQHNHQIPNAVWLGSKPVAPEAFLVAMAKIASNTAGGGAPPELVTVAPARLATEKYIALDSPEIWSWPIFPEGFHSEHLMDLARGQAWTLKPAKRSE